jgi:hypothetical protein
MDMIDNRLEAGSVLLSSSPISTYSEVLNSQTKV